MGNKVRSMVKLNDTHDPARRSWVAEANEAGCDFPIQNLPFGVFRPPPEARPRGGVAIGNHVLDLSAALAAGLFSGAAASAARAASGETLNALLAMDASSVSTLRARLSDLLNIDGADSGAARAISARLLVPMPQVQMELPVAISGFTDFSCSYTHLVGMRGGQPVTAFFYLPIGYNGRASSVRVSGTPVKRPSGQWAAKPPEGEMSFGPEPHKDFELELAAFVGRGNDLGTSLGVDEASERIFGCCLLNDWSARGIQFFESILGPFLGKSFGTTVSPWIVTAEALAPFRTSARRRAAGDPSIPSYLFDPSDQAEGGLAVELTAYLRTTAM